MKLKKQIEREINVYINFQKCQQQSYIMEISFLQDVVKKHKNITKIPSTNELKTWTAKTISILFPQYPQDQLNSIESVSRALKDQKQWLVKILNVMKKELEEKPQILAQKFFDQVPKIYEHLKEDIHAIFHDDPAARSEVQIIRAYPGFSALSYYRIAHELHALGIPMIPRFITECAHYKTGIDIHPGAKIGHRFYIDHGTGTVIGQTAVIGNDVKVYQGVTLGALSVKKKLQDKIRHPKLEDNVIVYAGATILGGQTIVGHHSVIGGNVWLTQSVPPYTKVFHRPQIEISKKFAPQISHAIENLIGNTPMVEIKNIFRNSNVRIFAKLQGQNPGGSVKDRPAYNMIKQALRRGQIKHGMKLIQPTSGNTGIALAMIAAMFDLNIQLVMPQNSTKQRIQTMQAYGAKVILTPADKGIEGSRDYAQAKVAKGGYKMLNQFANPDNLYAHYKGTGPEVYRDTQGNVTHFVSSMGTTGTIMGTSMFLKQKNPQIQIIGVQPDQNAKIPGIRRWAPQYLPKIFDRSRVDEIINVSQEQAEQMTLRLAKQQAIFAGVSSGGAMAAAVRLARTLQKGLIVTIVCDRGDRYLSSNLFSKGKPDSSSQSSSSRKNSLMKNEQAKNNSSQ